MGPLQFPHRAREAQAVVGKGGDISLAPSACDRLGQMLTSSRDRLRVSLAQQQLLPLPSQPTTEFQHLTAGRGCLRQEGKENLEGPRTGAQSKPQPSLLRTISRASSSIVRASRSACFSFSPAEPRSSTFNWRGKRPREYPSGKDRVVILIRCLWPTRLGPKLGCRPIVVFPRVAEIES